MNNLAKLFDLPIKIKVNRVLLAKLIGEYGDSILFTGGTSLMERKLIFRFSEDIDIITTISRKEIENFLAQDKIMKL